jgi:hypothetical protein
MNPLDLYKQNAEEIARIIEPLSDEIKCYTAILREVKRNHSKIYDHAISKVKASGKYDDSMFEYLGEE